MCRRPVLSGPPSQPTTLSRAFAPTRYGKQVDDRFQRAEPFTPSFLICFRAAQGRRQNFLRQPLKCQPCFCYTMLLDVGAVAVVWQHKRAIVAQCAAAHTGRALWKPMQWLRFATHRDEQYDGQNALLSIRNAYQHNLSEARCSSTLAPALDCSFRGRRAEATDIAGITIRWYDVSSSDHLWPSKHLLLAFSPCVACANTGGGNQ